MRLEPTTARPVGVTGLHKYFGTIVLAAASDGLVVVNPLSLERYLLGLNEVPTTWPPAALQAQAVAARTYAARTLAAPPAGAGATYGFDICASVDCQVFAGADVVLSPGGDAWRAAVEDTAGQILTYDGAAILARYHSTSGGVTLDNEDVYVGEPGYPYLTSVESRYERASPLFRWRTTFPVRRLERMALAAGLWNAGNGRLREAVTVESSTGRHYPDVVLRGSRGFISITAEELRDALRDLAPSLYPDAYPAPAVTSSGRLPETFPSNRYEMRTRGRTAFVVGRGWGHGVGMSQYGAFGMALRGFGYREILAHYYRGADLVTAEPAGVVDVGVAWQQPTVSVEGEFRIVDATGRTLVEDALGTWRFRATGSEIAIEPPTGYDLPLTIDIVEVAGRVEPGAEVEIQFVVSKPARVSISSRPATKGRSRVFSAGRRTATWRAPDTPGEYELHLVARAGDASHRSAPVAVMVADPVSASGPAAPDPGSSGLPGTAVIVSIATALVAATAVTIAVWVRQRR